MDELTFWKTCCSRGITICYVPKPFKGELRCWLVSKCETFDDRNKWAGSHTFDTDTGMRSAVQRYLETGVEPPGRYENRETSP
jgi:hypothetical protein